MGGGADEWEGLTLRNSQRSPQEKEGMKRGGRRLRCCSGGRELWKDVGVTDPSIILTQKPWQQFPR